MGCRELWKVPTEPHSVEATQVILACLNGFEDFVALHVVQWCTKRIRILHFLARFCVVTGHLVLLIPPLKALADLLIPPRTEVYIHAMSKTMVAGFLSLCCQALVVWCWGWSPQFFCLNRPSLPPPRTQRSHCCLHCQTPQPHCRILQLPCHWSQPIVSCHLLVHPHCQSLCPCCQSLHPHHQSLHLPCCLSCHLPGIQYHPRCHSLSHSPGLTLSGSHVSRCWLWNSIGMHFANTTARDSWTGNGMVMKSASGSRTLLSRWSGLERLTCQNYCHLFFPHSQATQVSSSLGERLLC